MTTRDKLIEIIREGSVIAGWHRYNEYETIADELIVNGVILLPCKVGDTVYVITTCNNVTVYKDWETGADECPFENICSCDECNDKTEMIYQTTISSIRDEGYGWLFGLRNLIFECDIDDFGTVAFFNREEAEQALIERSNNNGKR